MAIREEVWVTFWDAGVENGKFETSRDSENLVSKFEIETLLREPERQKRQWKPAEAHQYTALPCFTVLIYCFSSINYTHELWNIRLLKTKRKEKTTNPRLWDPSAKKIRDFETLSKTLTFLDFEMGPKFFETYVFRGIFLYYLMLTPW